MSSQSGLDRGLSLVLDAGSHLLADRSVRSDALGFTAHVGAVGEYPWVRDRGFMVEPGMETHVRLGATKVRASEYKFR